MARNRPQMLTRMPAGTNPSPDRRLPVSSQLYMYFSLEIPGIFFFGVTLGSGCDTRARVESGGMSEGRDPAIKLFGRKIPLPEEHPQAEEGSVSDLVLAVEPLTEGEKDTCKEKANSSEVNEMLDGPGGEEVHQKSSSFLSNGVENEQKSSTEIEKEAEESDSSHEDKLVKKPDKVLQCPRCNSMDTKFCYYNNYNINQPRHFCKNCQRYWTAGGTMRNVPVGAGRRKLKNCSSSTHQHTLVTPPNVPLGASAPPTKTLPCSLRVLKFGPDDPPLCDSISSVLNLGEQNTSCDQLGGFKAPAENREEPSCSSSPVAAEQNGRLSPLHHWQCFPVPPWAYAWNPVWTNAAAIPWIPPPPPPMVAAPAFCAAPYPFIPASFWGCMPNWASTVPWNLPLAVGNNNGLSLSLSSSSSSTNNSNCSGNGSPTLGKHYRDAAPIGIGEETAEKSLWIPKTSRIDDIDDAAKSSIFATLGIKPDERGGGAFKAFHSKTDEGSTRLLHENPAALSRSQSFQETTA